MILKRVVKYLCPSVLILVALLCYSPASAEPILVEGDFNYPPYEFLDNGIPSGFNIDIVRAVAAAEDLDIRIQLHNWADVVKSLENGECDVISGMFYSKDRSEKFEFSMPHNVVSHSVFVRKNSSIKSVKDIKRHEVLVQRSDIMHEYGLKNLPEAKIIPVESQEDALLLLSSGKHDAALLGKLQNLYKAEKAKLTNIVAVGPIFASEDYCFAVKKGNTKLISQLNEGLNLIRKSGEYDRIYKKWFDIYERKGVYQEFVKYAVMILTPLLIFLFFFILLTWFLRNRIKKKTHELTAELIERQRAEKELITVQGYLTSVIDSMPSILIGVDKNCNITQWNKEAERVYGVRQSSVIGLPLDLAAPHLACEMERVREALKTGEMQASPRMRSYIEGRAKYEDVTVYPLRSKGVEGAVIRIDDITERINLEQMIMQSEKMLSIGGLAAGMAHEINNPLAVISGNAQNIKRRVSTTIEKNIEVAEQCGTTVEAMYKYFEERGINRMLDSIIESGNRAAKIVVNMLSFSRKSDKVMTEHNIVEILDNTLELASSDYDLKKEYDFKKIIVVREYEKCIPQICCESNEIQQVFLNLFRNGAEAMAEKTYNIDVPKFILRVKKIGEMVRIEIEDNGPGMKDETCKRIFEPFYTTKDVGQGTGLGLSVSYFIVTDHHKGTMEVDSMLGHWTKFTIKLPIKMNCVL
ncbi:transporter substrate-binding domain-containing protein [Maridesulfovibrio sp. FT414]|uniref:transporter substrate-binding domain-containing protein n=1 Tax=Maridesulfovibrio sp. FT414 TaxID=2979469 RepID=UPI003D80842E